MLLLLLLLLLSAVVMKVGSIERVVVGVESTTGCATESFFGKTLTELIMVETMEVACGM